MNNCRDIACWSHGSVQLFLPFLLVDTMLVTWFQTAISTLLIGGYNVGRVVQNSNFYPFYWSIQWWPRASKQPFVPFLLVDTMLVTWLKKSTLYRSYWWIQCWSRGSKTALTTVLIGGYNVGHVVQKQHFLPFLWSLRDFVTIFS